MSEYDKICEQMKVKPVIDSDNEVGLIRTYLKNIETQTSYYKESKRRIEFLVELNYEVEPEKYEAIQEDLDFFEERMLDAENKIKASAISIIELLNRKDILRNEIR